MSPRALQQAPFRVLVGANMPAVLVEMGFLTNPSRNSSSPPTSIRTRSCRRSSTASSAIAARAGREPTSDDAALMPVAR